jgi:hypothetical protein
VAPSFPDEGAREEPAVTLEQHAAAAAPGKRTRDLIGNFGDFDRLFEQLAEPPLFELGNPLPKSEYMPKGRAGTCPAAHNEALLRDGN